MVKGFDHGILAGAAVAAVYGVLTEPFALSFGLLAVGFVGGMIIGASVSRGAWNGEAHWPSRRVRALATAIGVGTWIAALFVAYLISQALIPQSSTTLLERLSASGFAEYFYGQVEGNLVGQIGGLFTLGYIGWRWAR